MREQAGPLAGLFYFLRDFVRDTLTTLFTARFTFVTAARRFRVAAAFLPAFFRLGDFRFCLPILILISIRSPG
jgi:hypothetical protein